MPRFSPFILSLSAVFSLNLGKAVFAQSGSSSVQELVLLEQRIRQSNDYQAVLASLQKLIEKDPHNAQAFFLAGMVLEKSGYSDLAAEYFAEADKLDPSRQGSALQVFRLKLDSGDMPAARSFLGYVSRHYPNDPSVLLMNAYLARLQGNKLLAELYQREALAAQPNVAGIASSLAVLRLSQGRFLEALGLAEHDLKLKKDHPAATIIKAQALLCLSRYREALPLLDRIYRQTDFEKRLAAHMLCQAYLAAGLYEQALEPALVEMALSKDRSRAVVPKMTVAMLVQKLPAPLVANVRDKVLKMLSQTEFEWRLHFSFADVLDHVGRHEDAMREYAKGLEIAPMVGRAWYRLGRDMEKESHYDNALVMYQRALQLDTGDPWIKAANLRLSQRVVGRPNDLAWRFKDSLRRGLSRVN